jgi:sulfoacetaldehyde acetyltransferase
VGDALKEAIASNRPSVLEIMVTQELGEPFRRDALKKPQRLLPKYQAYSVAAE